MLRHGLFSERILRRQVLLLLLVEFFWGMGVYFTLPATTIPSYLRALGAPPAIIGLTAMAMGALPLLLQFFGRPVINRFRNRQWALVLIHLIVIVPYFIIPLIDILLAGRNPAALIWSVVLLLGFSQMVLGIAVPVWLDMLARIIPLPVRGRYFGLASGVVAVGGIIGGAVLMAMQRWLGDGVYRGLFLATGCCYVSSMVAFARVPVPKEAFDHPADESVFSCVKRGLKACHPRLDYPRFIGSSMMLTFALSIIPFLVIFATDAHRGLGFPKGIFGEMTFVQALGGAIGSIIIGWLVDRLGPRWPWVGLVAVLGAVLLLFPHASAVSIGGLGARMLGYPLLLMCSLLIGVLSTNWSVSAPAILQFAPDGDKSGYIALANIIAFVPATIGPMAMAWLIASGPGYHGAFAAALVGTCAALLLAFTIRGRKAR